ncbi:MAG: peptide ABC transporter substrate-binding protein [Clostridiales bacterium]|jgi:oligopeptide transport system substrate-binding protein|nr:peptide ABC transporter substrate-binding protein [Clostridiales bacterium]
MNKNTGKNTGKITGKNTSASTKRKAGAGSRHAFARLVGFLMTLALLLQIAACGGGAAPAGAATTADSGTSAGTVAESSASSGADGSTSAADGTSASSASSDGAHLVVAGEGETGSFDPAKNVGRTYWSIHSYCLEGLLQYTQAGEIEYRAAESYEVNDDMTVWTFHLRKDGKWSDGSPVTSADFKNTIIRALDPANQSTYADMLFYIKGAEDAYMDGAPLDAVGVETPDDETLVFTLRETCPFFLKLLFVPVYFPSKHDVATDENENWDKDVSTYFTNGAFMLSEYNPGESFVYVPNPYYYDRDKVKLASYTSRFMDDMQARLAAYQTGEIDVVGTAPYYVLERYKDQPDINIAKSLSSLYTLLNAESEALKDPKVREALVISVNRRELCDILGADKAPSDHFVSMNMSSIAESGKLYAETAAPMFTEDAARAKQLLAEAGYPDGAGFPTLLYIYPNTEEESNVAQVLQNQWKQTLGVTIELSGLEQQVYLSERRAGNFDLARMSWTADFGDPMTYLAMYTSYSKQNDNHVNDPEYDALVERSISVTDAVEREAMLHEAEFVLVGKGFYLSPLYVNNSITLVNPSYTGFDQDFRGLFDMRFVYAK